MNKIKIMLAFGFLSLGFVSSVHAVGGGGADNFIMVITDTNNKSLHTTNVTTDYGLDNGYSISDQFVHQFLFLNHKDRVEAKFHCKNHTIENDNNINHFLISLSEEERRKYFFIATTNSWPYFKGRSTNHNHFFCKIEDIKQVDILQVWKKFKVQFKSKTVTNPTYKKELILEIEQEKFDRVLFDKNEV